MYQNLQLKYLSKKKLGSRKYANRGEMSQSMSDYGDVQISAFGLNRSS